MLDHFAQLDIDQLLNIYHDSFASDAQLENSSVNTIEDRFTAYLHDIFFSAPNAVYGIWTKQGQYVSAARMEPFMDGMLISGLVTALEERRNGYALMLLQSLLDWCKGQNIQSVYSHVARNNLASNALHRRCGFQRAYDFAHLIDGTVSSRYITYRKNI